jgi:hypothetical protein
MRRLALVLVLAACKREEPPPPDADAMASAAAPIASVAPDAGVADPGSHARLVVATWDRNYNAGDVNALMTLYAPSVRYYGVTLTREQCQAKVASSIAAGPGRKQTSKIDAITRVPPVGARVTFTKEVTSNGKTTTYPSYFHLVRSVSGALQIDEESDPVTDKTLAAGVCEDSLAALARATDAASSSDGTTTVSLPAKPGDHWVAVFFRPHGSSEIDLDPKTGIILRAAGSDRTPLDQSNPTLRGLADKAKSKCK